jgi:hypothetical protein
MISKTVFAALLLCFCLLLAGCAQQPSNAGKQESGAPTLEAVASPTPQTTKTNLFSADEAQAFYSRVLEKYGGRDSETVLGEDAMGDCKHAVDAKKFWFWKEFDAYKRYSEVSVISVAAFADAENAQAFFDCMSRLFELRGGKPQKISSNGVNADFYENINSYSDSKPQIAVSVHKNVFVYVLGIGATGARKVFSEIAETL